MVETGARQKEHAMPSALEHAMLSACKGYMDGSKQFSALVSPSQDRQADRQTERQTDSDTERQRDRRGNMRQGRGASEEKRGNM